MWKIKHVKKDHIENYLLVGEELIVGRKDASLLITNDPSLSRRHAVLFLKHPEENLNNPSKKSSLFLRDEKSKYGTFRNGLRITSEVELVDGDVVKFGQFESEFRVYMQPYIVTTSCLELPAKRVLKKLILKLGGNLISEWQPSCTHLVMPEVKVTVKALCCLVSCKPIVKPEYFQELTKSLQCSSSFIKPHQYIPPIGEALIDKDKVSFDINPLRKSLFENKTFFFFDEKQFKKLHLGIILGGGNATILNKDTTDLQILLGDGMCVIEPTKELISSQGVRDLFTQITLILQKKELRMIPESDIGLAVAYCSTEKFCNPHFVLSDSAQSQRIQSQSLTQREVYVPDTEQQIKRKEQKHAQADEAASNNLQLPSINQGDSAQTQKIQSQSLTQREVYVPDTEQQIKRKEQKYARADEAASNNLHLPSINQEAAEEMEVSGISLSAQIKQELDDLFDDIIETKTAEQQQSKSVHPISPQPPPTKKQKRCMPKEQTEVHSPGENAEVERSKPEIIQNTPPKRFSFEDNNQLKKNSKSDKVKRGRIKYEITQDSSPERLPMNGNNSPIEDTKVTYQNEPELPRNLMKIEYVSLLCRKPAPVTQPHEYSTVKNFKKFKKVYSKKMQVLPRIIGAHELVPYDKVTAAASNEVWEDTEEDVLQPPIRGEFDWDTPAV